MRAGFTPDAELLVAGAVKIGRYDYFATQVVRRAVRRDRDYDPERKSSSPTGTPSHVRLRNSSEQ